MLFICVFVSSCVFFFKQKTAYEMRISDWSSDVCSSDLHVLGALALELTPGSAAARDALPQREAGELGAAIARDLAKFSPEAATLDLTTAGAHYDPVELLRPGWPELGRAARRERGCQYV